MTAAARRRRRTPTKTDPVDALEIARIAARDDDLPAPRFAGVPGELACLVAYRRELVKDRTAAVNGLHSSLEKIRCRYHTRTAALTSRAGLDAASRLLRGDRSARAEIARSPIPNIRRLDREIGALSKRLAAALNDTHTSLMSIYGVGPLVAAEILAETGDPARFTTKSPLRDGQRHRPHQPQQRPSRAPPAQPRRQPPLNKAIHIAAIAQISKPDSEGRTYHQRCLDRGKSKRESIRALKRRIPDRVWTCLQNDIQTTNPAPNLT